MENKETYYFTAILYTDNKRYLELEQMFQQVKNFLNSYRFTIDNTEYSFEFDIVQTKIENIFSSDTCKKTKKSQKFVDFALVLGCFNNLKQKDNAIYNKIRCIEIDYSNYVEGYDPNNTTGRQYVLINNNRKVQVNFLKYIFSTFRDEYSSQEISKLAVYAHILEMINKEFPNLFSQNDINYLLSRLNFITNNNDSAIEYYEKFLNYSIQNNLVYSFYDYYSLLFKNKLYNKIINFFTKLSFKSIEDKLRNDLVLAKVYDIIDSSKAIETYSSIIDECLKINTKNKKPYFLSTITEFYSNAVIKKSKYFNEEGKKSQLKSAINVLNEKRVLVNPEYYVAGYTNILKEYIDNFNAINDLVYIYNACSGDEAYYELRCEIFSLLINGIMKLKPWRTMENYDYSYFIEMCQKQMLVNDYYMNTKRYNDKEIKKQILKNGILTIVILVMANEIALADKYSLYINNYIVQEPNKSELFWNRSKQDLIKTVKKYNPDLATLIENGNSD